MRTKTLAAFALLAATLLAACAMGPFKSGPTLDEVIAGEHRTPAFRERDKYRHPKETLEFFGIRPDMTVVEVWPGAGWYTEILAPYLRAGGQFYAAGFAANAPKAPDYWAALTKRYRAKLDARPDLYDRVVVTELGPKDQWQACPPGTADMVLTFRNVHNWMEGGYEKEMFRAFHAALKPGGVLGVVEHRANPGTKRSRMIASGYVTEDYVIRLATEAGFTLDAKSEVNANPKDTKNWKEGVWTLPPSLARKDKNREKYLAIGESDRMTLRFVKPAS